MNQENVKQKLLQLEKVDTDFTVTFSDRKSKKVDGLYYPDRREIIIHNQNFVDENQLMYTAIHEYAHHIQFLKPDAPQNTRAHTNDHCYIKPKSLEYIKIIMTQFANLKN